MGKFSLNSLKWEGNSRAMYSTIIQSVPIFFKAVVEGSVLSWIKDHDVTTVTEDMVIQAFEENAPFEMKSKLLPVLNQMRQLNNQTQE